MLLSVIQSCADGSWLGLMFPCCATLLLANGIPISGQEAGFPQLMT